MPRLVYLDNAATTRVDPRVLDAMLPALSSNYGNASSLHAAGRAARKALEGAREAVAAVLGCDRTEVIFTGGGTESDNLAILGAARAARERGRTHVVTTTVEHSAVLKSCARLEAEGFRITRVPVDAGGHVTAQAIRAAVGPDTALVSVMAVNNEVGTIQPLAEIGAVARAAGALFHVDAVQGAGKIPLRPVEWNADLAAISGHKFHGPKGVGLLYVRRGTKLVPLAFGGEHEFERRPGTENVAGIVGCAEALRLAESEREANVAHVRVLRDRLETAIRTRIPAVVFNGVEPRTANMLNVSFRHVEGEAILLNLDARGICVSTGSACSAHSAEPSHVLTAMGRSKELAQGSIRFSFSRDNTVEDVDLAVGAIVEVVEKLRRMSPLWEEAAPSPAVDDKVRS